VLCYSSSLIVIFFFFQAEDGIRDSSVTGVQTCALPIYTITIDPQGTATGSATLTLYDVPPDVTGSLAIGGPPQPVSVGTPGQNRSEERRVGKEWRGRMAEAEIEEKQGERDMEG